MNVQMQQAMRDATTLTRAGDLLQATAAIQRALAGARQPVLHGRTAPLPALALPSATTPAQRPAAGSPGQRDPRRDTHAADAMIAGLFESAGQPLAYKLYVPTPVSDRPMPLLLMLHGCTQNPDDFAAGTAMHALAREAGVCVLYPAQSQRANASRCWNWFLPEHQQRGGGEPAALAALVRSIITRFGLDASRVYVAGLSAGGAMAAVLAAAYPDLFAAVGVHSGLAVGSAANVAQALSMMKSGAAGPSRRSGARSGAVASAQVPTIVFHGDADHTVHPRNGDQVLAAALPEHGSARPSVRHESGVAPGGRRFVRTLHVDVHGQTIAEHWRVDGLGHAWSGGQAAGSYTDAAGPDASAQMLRFFLEQQLPRS